MNTGALWENCQGLSTEKERQKKRREHYASK